MAVYICEADQPCSSLDLELTEHRDGTYDAALGYDCCVSILVYAI